MNPPSSQDDPLHAGERFLDAALSEHARLGNEGRDAELVHRILLETVHRQPAAARASLVHAIEWRTWLTGAAAVAALVTLAVVVLSSLGTGRQERPSEELSFTVRILETPVRPETSPEKGPATSPSPQIAAKSYTGPVALASPALASGATSPDLSPAGYELITTLGPSFDSLPAGGSRRENFRITADESLASSDRRLYRGRVVVEHAQYRIEASEVSVPVPGRATTTDASPLLASNVTVTQGSPRRVAHAKNLHFDPLSGAIVLSGVKSFETDGGKLARFAPGDQLVLNGEGFSVEKPAPVKYASPQPVTR